MYSPYVGSLSLLAGGPTVYNNFTVARSSYLLDSCPLGAPFCGMPRI